MPETSRSERKTQNLFVSMFTVMMRPDHLNYHYLGDLRDRENYRPIGRALLRAIGHVLSDMDVELTAMEQRQGNACAHKQTMIQESLTGRTRLA